MKLSSCLRRAVPSMPVTRADMSLLDFWSVFVTSNGAAHSLSAVIEDLISIIFLSEGAMAEENNG